MIDNKKIQQFANQTQSPCYVFDLDIFNERVKKVKDAFGQNVDICFSIKANPFLIPYLTDDFEKIEVCSPGELTICEKTSVDMSKVIFSGVNKTKQDIKRAANDKVGTFTVESLLHLKLINETAIENNCRYDVLLRVADSTQFGMDEDIIFDIISNRDECKGVNIVGLHYFTGTSKRKAKSILKELDYLSELVDRIKKELSFDLQKIEYGTGLAVDYFSSDEEIQRLSDIADGIKALGQKIPLTVEMGRFFAAGCGFYFTKVVDCKTNAGVNYAICDGGLNHLKYDGQIQGMKIPQIIHLGKEGDNAEKWTVCGSLCTTADVLVRDAEFYNIKIGDTLVFCKTGAYSACEGMALFLSRELPAIFVYSESLGLKKLRDITDASQFNTPKEI